MSKTTLSSKKDPKNTTTKTTKAMHIKNNTVLRSINIYLLCVNFIVQVAHVVILAIFIRSNFPSLSFHPWAVGPHTPLVTVKRNPLNVDLVLQVSQGPRLQSLSDVQALRQLPELDGPPNVQPFRESSLKGFARTRLLRVRRRKRRRKVMLPRRTRGDWGGGAAIPILYAAREVISLLLCFCHDVRYVISQLNMTIALFNYQINVQQIGQIASYIFVATQGKSGAALETLSVVFYYFS